MNIYILGSSGVIGHGISKKLLNHNLIGFDSKIYDKIKKKYKKKLIRNNCDVFIHAAGVTDEEIVQNHINAFDRANSNLAELLEHLKKKKCNYFIYISSLRIYDENSNFFHEKKSSININDDYKLCHYIAEKNIINFCIKNKKKYLIIRPGAVYGFGKNKKINRKNLIPYSFPLELVKKNKIVLKTSGNQLRNFCFNEDIGELINKWLTLKNIKSYITNVNGSQTMSVKQFARLCIDIYQKKFKKNGKIITKNKNIVFKKKLIKINQNLKKKFPKNLNKFINQFMNSIINHNEQNN